MTEVNYIQKLNAFIRVCGECIEDLEMSRKGVPVYYNIDFSLLCPVLFNFPNAPAGSKDFLISEKDSTTRILDKNPGDGHFKLVVSGPTITEFFDQLDHSMRHIQTQIPALQNRFRVKDMEDERILRNTISTSSEIRRQLSIVTQKGLDESLRAPINRLLGLLDRHKLQGIGDVLNSAAIREQTDRATFDRFVAEQTAYRPDARYPEDRTFHFKIDASNVCLALAASHVQGIRAPFVTTTPMNIKQCTLGDRSFARFARTPLFLLNAHRLKQNHEISDELEFLSTAAKEAFELIEAMQGHTSFKNYPSGLQLRLARFYQTQIAMLEKGSHQESPHEDKHLDEIVKNLSNDAQLKSVMADALQDAKDGARLVELHSAQFDLPYLDQFDFSNDPIIERIKKNLGVTLRQE